MLFSQNRETIRQAYCDAWAKFRDGRPLEPLEHQIVEVVKWHPEYHALLEDPQAALDQDYTPERGVTNPFLHMGLHIALNEQIGTDRPAGIAAAYQAQLRSGADAHDIAHAMIECLAEMLWRAQRDNTLPDEKLYLACVRRGLG